MTANRTPSIPAEHVHGPDCDLGHDHARADAHEHVHGPECAHHHHHAAVQPYRRAVPKLGRNDPCWCGSGKKLKKCHGAAA
jgi:hypothetical protein